MRTDIEFINLETGLMIMSDGGFKMRPRKQASIKGEK